MMRQETPGGTPTGTDPRRYGFRKALEAVKEAVPILDEADLLCGPAGTRTGLRRMGERWVGKCPLPDHTGKGEDGRERTPSFTVDPSKERWRCFGCDRGGDVLDLHQLAHGYAEKWEALVSLAQERGVELPRRSDRWLDNTETKSRILRHAAEKRGEVLKERCFGLLMVPLLKACYPDPEEYEAELAKAWHEWGSKPRNFWTWVGERSLGRG